jgi:16S rRNA C1402 N4-methylase RsmH
MSTPHISVLPNEIKEIIRKIQPKRALDFTFGAGGHSKIILENSNCILT